MKTDHDAVDSGAEPAGSGRHAFPDEAPAPGVGAMPPPPTVPPAPAEGGWWRTGKARVLLATVLVLLIALAGGGYWWFVERLPGGVAFRANGVEVTDAQLDEQVKTLGAMYGIQPPTDVTRLDKFRRDVAKSTAMSMVIDQAAADRKIVVDDRQVVDYLNRFVVQYFGPSQEGRDNYLKDLQSKGTSEPKVLAELKRQMLLKELFTQVTGAITVNDQDVRAEFDRRQAEFGTPERRELLNIVVASRPDADAVLAEVNAPGADFGAVAGQRSLDTTNKAAGGSLGTVAAGDLDPAYAAAAFAAPAGAVFGPVEAQRQNAGGPTTVFNVGKVVQVLPAVPADFEQVKDAVKQTLFRERSEAAWRDYLTHLVKDADVDYADSYRPEDPYSLPPTGGVGQPGATAPPR